jgi:hypothetical protein
MTESMTLRAGALRLLWEKGALRQIRYRDKEVIRNLYFSLRDQDWGTVPFVIQDLQQNHSVDAFTLQFSALHQLDGRDLFRWEVKVEGSADSHIVFFIQGQALVPFWRNRVGFCILHPIEECAGKPVEIITPEGKLEQHFFPKLISPQRPFPILQGMRWEIEPGLKAELQCSGDAFETEDQRNWTDTSYKTFCTPLALPVPVLLEPGTTIEQRITLQLQPSPSPIQESEATSIQISQGTAQFSLPALGTLQPLELATFSTAQIEALRSLQLNHLRIEVRLLDEDWPSQWQRGASQAQALDLPLLIALSVGEESLPVLQAFLKGVVMGFLKVQEILLLHQHHYVCSATMLARFIPLIRATLPDVKLGAGVQTNYAELGRNIFEATALDFISFGINPQIHAFDDLSMVENIDSQADALHSAQALYPQKEVYVSPLTLRKRFNASAKNPEDRFMEETLAKQADPRQKSAFAAAWLMGSIKTLAEAGAQKLTLFRAAGALGLIDASGVAYPTYHLLRQLATWRGAKVIQTQSSDKLACKALCLEKDGANLWIVANHTAHEQQVWLAPLEQELTLAPYEMIYLSGLNNRLGAR